VFRSLRAAAIVLVLLAAACHRTPAPGSAPVVQAIDVENRTARILVVSFEDSRGTGVLGTVRAGSTDRFVLADAGGGQITVRGRSQDGTVTSGPYTVRLASVSTPKVVLE
jgi:hypothetical protein